MGLKWGQKGLEMGFKLQQNLSYISALKSQYWHLNRGADSVYISNPPTRRGIFSLFLPHLL
jgi:hypothetical protein